MKQALLFLAFSSILLLGFNTSLAQTNSPTTPIPGSYFGLTTQNINTSPALNFPAGTIRNLDVYLQPTSAQTSLCTPAGSVSPAINWAYINRCGADNFDWTNLDAWVANAVSNGQTIVFDLGSTPTWASSSPASSSYVGAGACGNPSSISSWDSWVWSVSNRYKTKIAYYELWNEPNDPTYWCGTIPQLALLGRDAFNIIKSNDPNAVFIGPAMTSSSGPNLLDQYYAAGGSANVGGVAFHGYLYSNTPSHAEDKVALIQDYKTVVAKYNLQTLPFLDTEDGWAAGSYFPADAAAQANFLAKDMILEWINGVKLFGWYAYDGTVQYGQLGTSSGLNAAGLAYQTVRGWIDGANAAGCTVDGGGTYRCSFSKPAYNFNFIVIWNSSNTGPYNASGYSNYVGLDGVQHSIVNNTVQVGSQPILVE